MVLGWDKTVSLNPKLPVIQANSAGLGQTPCSVASDDWFALFANVPVQVLQVTLFTMHSDGATRIIVIWILSSTRFDTTSQ